MIRHGQSKGDRNINEPVTARQKVARVLSRPHLYLLDVGRANTPLLQLGLEGAPGFLGTFGDQSGRENQEHGQRGERATNELGPARHCSHHGIAENLKRARPQVNGYVLIELSVTCRMRPLVR